VARHPNVPSSFTLDDVRRAASILERPSRRSLLRCLDEVAQRRRVLPWDQPLWLVEAIVVSDGIDRRTLRVGPTGRWAVSPPRRISRGRRPVPFHPVGDVYVEYVSTRRYLAALRARLKARAARDSRRLPQRVTLATARRELLRLLDWPEQHEAECPLHVVDEGGEPVVRVRGNATAESRIWTRFIMGAFSPAPLAKEIVAAHRDWSIRTLERRLTEAPQHYRDARLAKAEAKAAAK
jgi:hypothetical protein